MKKCAKIRSTGKIVGLERIAVMAALNMSHELLKAKEHNRYHIETQLRRIASKIDQSLNTMDRED